MIKSDLPIGTKVFHQIHQDGVVIKDPYGLCFDDEVIVKFELFIGRSHGSKSQYAEFVDTKWDIFPINELTLI